MNSTRLLRAINVSLAIGVLMLVAKWIAFLLTGSSVIFSDAAESVVHIIAVWFAWYAVRVTTLPPDNNHHYGHDKIGFVSAGVEGGLICIAAIVIIMSAVTKWYSGIQLENLGYGSAITAGAGIVNAALGMYLVRVGRAEKSLVVEANGSHVMTDAWTSLGAIVGLLLAKFTGILWLDPLMAILFGANIIREGSRLVTESIKGLMDTTNPELEQRVRTTLEQMCVIHNVSFHRLRLRMSGKKPMVDYHLQVNDEMRMIEAHALATIIEDEVRLHVGNNAEVFTHLESDTQPDGHI